MTAHMAEVPARTEPGDCLLAPPTEREADQKWLIGELARLEQ
ncbi:MAG: hypothetical protein OXN16_00705 [Gammaproteobacteria bacterium]|nr:hypothetical protein [Gammaproteobacteria bacterium]MDE0279590.1 hypothetical protein [Gammaproteobacteria bacterium]